MTDLPVLYGALDVVALTSRNEGTPVALIEAGELGGTCLNRGCIPTKALIANAELLYNLRKFEKHGIHASNLKVNFPTMQQTKDETVVGTCEAGSKRITYKKN